MNAEVTAENKPDYTKPRGEHKVPSDSSSPIHSTRLNTHKNKRGIQVLVVFPLKIPVMLFHFSLKLAVELRSGVGPSSRVT